MYDIYFEEEDDDDCLTVFKVLERIQSAVVELNFYTKKEETEEEREMLQRL